MIDELKYVLNILKVSQGINWYNFYPNRSIRSKVTRLKTEYTQELYWIIMYYTYYLDTILGSWDRPTTTLPKAQTKYFVFLIKYIFQYL